MDKIVLLLKKIHLGLLFLIIEGVSLYFFFSTDIYMYSKYLIVRENLTKGFEKYTSEIKYYFSLRESNEALLQMNARLLAENNHLKAVLDTVVLNSSKNNYPNSSLALKVIRNEFLNTNNFIVLDGGKIAGVKKGMAVVSNYGIVGYVSEISDNYSIVVSLLSTDNFVSSAKIKDKPFSGSLSWNGKETNKIQMAEVLKYAELHIGDTVLTTSYSSVFPENIPIGTVDSFKITDGTFYTVDVNTFTDFSKLAFVYLLELKNKEERDSLEHVSGINNNSHRIETAR